ncbi:MAG: hypothetical protein ACQEQY_02080, partial [Halobacteriota archaeon]
EADAEATPETDADPEPATGTEDAEPAAGTEDAESGGPGIADAIETAESDPAAAETGALVETVGEGGADAADGNEDESTESRSLLSKLTGGLFG